MLDQIFAPRMLKIIAHVMHWQSHYTGTALLGMNSDLLVEIIEAYLHSHNLIRNWTEPCLKVMSLLDVALEDAFVAARLVLTVYLSRRLLRLRDKELGWPYNRQP